MRSILIILLSLGFLSSGAQSALPVGRMNYGQWYPFSGYNPLGDSVHAGRKWYVSTYAGVSAGLGMYNGGSAMMLSAPVGIQLNHPLNNNLIAFAGVSAGPAVYNFNQAFLNPHYNASYPGNNFQNAYGFGVNTRMEMGLMYVNDARTFSISGSIGIEQTYSPAYPSIGMENRKPSGTTR